MRKDYHGSTTKWIFTYFFIFLADEWLSKKLHNLHVFPLDSLTCFLKKEILNFFLKSNLIILFLENSFCCWKIFLDKQRKLLLIYQYIWELKKNSKYVDNAESLGSNPDFEIGLIIDVCYLSFLLSQFLSSPHLH